MNKTLADGTDATRVKGRKVAATTVEFSSVPQDCGVSHPQEDRDGGKDRDEGVSGEYKKGGPNRRNVPPRKSTRERGSLVGGRKERQGGKKRKQECLDMYEKESEDCLEQFSPRKRKLSKEGEEKKRYQLLQVKNREDNRNGQSTKATGENSSALNKFLENVLKAQRDFKWIDQTVHNINEKNLEKSNRRSSKLREKRGSGRSYGTLSNAPEFPSRNYLSNDFDDTDASQNGMNNKEVHPSPPYDKAPSDIDQIPKDWSKTKDLCSLSDWLNSNASPDDRSIRDSTGIGKEANAKRDARLNVRNQRDETRKDEAPSLESLKETILELKKSLNGDSRKHRQNSKNAGATKTKEKENEERRRARARNKQRKDEKENDDDANSGWWDNAEAEKLDLKKREQDDEDVDEKNAHLKVWRTKRTEVNNDDGNPKLFHRAGFGEPYLEEDTLKESHDRKRRSKGTPSDEKRHLNEARSKNNPEDEEKNSMEISKATPGCSDADTDLQQTSNLTNNLPDAVNSKLTKEAGRNRDESRNYEQSDLSHEERGKLSLRAEQEKRSAEESGDINILLKSENKNLIELSNTGAGESSAKGEKPPFTLNMFDVKKKTIVGNEDKPGKSVSTIFNVKIEKAEVDTPIKTNDKEVRNMAGEDPFAGVLVHFGKNKVKEERHEDTPGSTDNMKQRNVDEKRLANSVKFDKEPRQRGVIEGAQNWFEGAARNQMNTNVDQAAAEKCNELGEKNKLNNEGRQLSDNKEERESVKDFDDKESLNERNNEGKNKKKYHQVFIVKTGDDRYGRRRILQYMEYSNDDLQDVDTNYNDKEEEESQRQVSAEKSDAPTRRKERSGYSDKKKKAKVNLLIKEKLNKKKQKLSQRNRRAPNVIEYYDYDSDAEQQDREESSPTSERQRSKNNYQEKNMIESDGGLAGDEELVCPPPEKKNKHEEAIQREEERRSKLKNKEPKQEFIGIDRSRGKNLTERTANTNGLSTLSTKVKFAEAEGSSNQQPGSRINRPAEGNEGKLLDRDTKQTVHDPRKCVLNVDKSSESSGIDDLFEEIQPVDETNRKVSKNVEPLYEELKKIYDWKEDETKSKPRIKGDQRMFYGSNDKLDGIAESFKDQVEQPEIAGPDGTPASSPNLLPLLLVYNGSGKSEIAAGTFETVSSGQLKNPAARNVSQSNYIALKRTDDMFKGGSEQSNSTEEKLRGPSTIGGGAAEWQRAQKVNGVRNGGALPEKDAASWSLTNKGQYIDTDSRSPYENRKYQESRLPRGREHVQNIDREKQMVISSGDLHESFVEPLEWIDDFDKDVRVRLGRSLKTVEPRTITYARSNTSEREDRMKRSSTTIDEGNSVHGSSESDRIWRGTTFKSEHSENGDNARVKREIMFPYDAFYDDIDQEHRDDSEKEEENSDPRRLNSYDDANNARQKFSDLDEYVENYDYLEDEDDYNKVARSANAKKKKKKHGSPKRQKKAKSRKRRHHKKHAKNSKSKNHEHKKHKKHASKSTSHHTNVKKSKVTQNESANERKGGRNKDEKEDVTNADNDVQTRRISSLLTADNMEDESQMDSALQGELAGKIVEQIFNQVQKNEDLKMSLGPGLYQKHKTRDTVAAEKSYRQAINDDEIKHTEELLNKIMLLLNRLIFDEVQRKTCISLPPDLIEFLDWMLEINPQETLIQVIKQPSLPLINEGKPEDHFPRDKFLFQSFPNQEMQAEINELYTKIRLIKSLIKEYNTLGDKDKAKIQSIQDYLARQLDLLLEYIEAKEESEKKGKWSSPIGGSRGMSNASNGSYSTRPATFSPLMNAPNPLKLSNVNFLTDRVLLRESKPDGIDVSHRGQRIIRSLDKRAKRNKKQRKHKKRKRKHGKRDKGASAIDQSRDKDTVHKAPALRQKREYLDKAFRDYDDSGYEEPLIYTSMDMRNVKSKGDGVGTLEKRDNVENKGAENGHSLKEKQGNIQSQIGSNLNEDSKKDSSVEEEAVTGKNMVEDEVILLNKRQAWKMENEQQLEEVAFGEDMRKATNEKKLFEKLTEIDKKKNDLKEKHRENRRVKDSSTNGPNQSDNLSRECSGRR
ncbi:hypothetical protein WH47_08858 [Habropoda laboriosa]|uniref:Uncharacterized protein n=1 Tax=Habropoda laboriosa TaxID=597456 RepID=A0A0L7R6G0_9HYME|nr:hypothetical protein WH47_08858 [Habropoda laboriosa]